MTQIDKVQLWLRRLGAGVIDWPLACSAGFFLCALPLIPNTLSFSLGISFCFALFECSKLQATPGKVLFGLKVTDGEGNAISFWEGALVRLIQLFCLESLVIAASILGSLELLLGWNIAWSLIFAVLVGLLSLSYFLFPKLFSLLPFTAIIKNRVVERRKNNVVPNHETNWSMKHAVGFDLNKAEAIWASIGLVLLTGLPFANQLIGDFIDNKLGSPKGPVVYSVKDIPENTQITTDELEILEVAQHRIPPDSIRSIDSASGRKCKYGISAGSIVSSHDLEPVAKTNRN